MVCHFVEIQQKIPQLFLINHLNVNLFYVHCVAPVRVRSGCARIRCARPHVEHMENLTISHSMVRSFSSRENVTIYWLRVQTTIPRSSLSPAQMYRVDPVVSHVLRVSISPSAIHSVKVRYDQITP